MGGKTSTTSSSVAVPSQVLAQYQSVNAKANATANTPFQDYGGEFVAPVNAEQGAGISNTNAAATEAQPYYGAATGVLGAAQNNTAPVNAAAEYGTAASSSPLTGQQINSYLSPYLGDVLSSTEALQNQSNQQAQAGQLGDAIRSGAFGSDRTGIAAANLQQQEDLANSNVVAGIANQGYQSALSTAQGQQQVGLAGAQQLANIGSTAYGEGANTASELGALGSGAESAGLAGANAQIGAGTVEQQTQQAQDTAQYNQFLQQQSYPFQVDQFLANIAEGTGALSGSTTTTQQPGGFFSDKRLKRDIKKIGETYDHQDVVTYKMGDDDRTRIGLIAQDVEKKHPEAVGLAGGFKVVDYGKATEKAANQGHFYAGGIVPFRRARAVGGSDDGLAGVLDAQQRMYSGMPGGGGQRQINASGSGGGHSLAVSNAPPAAPQSGLSQVNSGINTVNNGYKLYNNLGRPGTSGPTGGVVPASAQSTALQPAGLQASGVTTAGADMPAATEGALATAAPMDTAVDAGATGAGEAAAGAGADAAAGAATGAAATAGTAAASEAAAALAAEYAAADVGALAILAAKRGGAIKRQGLDTGGTPYLEASVDGNGNINIPEEANTSSLKAAPGAGKQPTGLQSMMKMANPTDWSDMAGSMFSNQALKTGGVAGRRHFDDGGSTDMSDSGMLDQVIVPADRDPTYDTVQVPDQTTTGVVAPDAIGAPPVVSDATPTGVAGSSAPADKPSSGGVKEFWENNKQYILPALNAISAMGTAKTVHPGVALAAGLGAGAESYVPTQTGLAKAADVSAQAQGRQLQNQFSQIGLDEYHKTDASGGEPLPSPVRPAGMTTSDPNDPQELAFQKFAPLPTARPDSVNQRVTAMKFAGKDSAADSLGAQWDQRMTGTNQTRTSAANTAYLNFSNAANAQPGQALPLVAKLNPQRAAQIQQSTQDPAQQDQQARDWAATMGLAAHQFSGRPTKMDNGVMIDEPLGQPVVGQNQVMTGLTPEGKQAAYNEGMQPVVLGNGLPGFRYQKSGHASIDQYVMAQDRAARTSSVAGAPGAPPAAAAAPRSTTPPVAPKPAAPPAVRPAPAQPATPAVSKPTADPYLNKALADPKFKLTPLPPVVDQTSKQAALDQQGINIKARSALLSDSEQAVPAASSALQYLNAAKSIMDSKGATVGAYGGLLTGASKLLGGGPQSTNYQELAKYLGNAAVQSGKANFPNATQSEVGLQLTELSPSKDMNAETINDLLSTNIRSAKYTLGSANRAKSYLDNGNDPQNFEKWNQNYYPRDKLVNATKTATGPNGQKLYRVNGQWVP